MKRTRPLKRKTPLKSHKPLRLKLSDSCQSGLRGLRGGGPLKRTGKLKHRSKKKIIQDAEYSKLRREFLSQHPLCMVCHVRSFMKIAAYGIAIVAPSTEVHHMARRGKHYLNTETWLATCRECHDYIEQHGVWARAHGFLLSPEERRLLEEGLEPRLGLYSQF